MCDKCRSRPGMIPIVDPNGQVYFICVECAFSLGKKEDEKKLG